MCGDDPLEAQQVSQSIQYYMAAKIGLTHAVETVESFNGQVEEDVASYNNSMMYEVIDDEIFQGESMTESSSSTVGLSEEFNNKMMF